ncbi:MAG: hypothetical protein NTX38_00595 [Methylobacter sp.]|nr:hypothetical protein [Methylobacter sp.]
MKKIKLISLAVVCAGLSSQVQAAPKLIPTMGSAATTYSFFTIQSPPAGVSALTVQTMLQGELDVSTALPKLTACWVTGDLNVTPVNCGNGAMQFANADLYTYNGASNIPPFNVSNALVVGIDPKKGTTLKKLTLTSKGANFRVGTVGVPNSGDTTGRVVNIHFNQRVAQFGMLVDSGQALAPSVSGIQFIVNRQTTLVKPLVAGAATFVGVEDSAGFTDISIIASGDVQSQSGVRAWNADQFAFVPLAKF